MLWRPIYIVLQSPQVYYRYGTLVAGEAPRDDSLAGLVIPTNRQRQSTRMAFRRPDAVPLTSNGPDYHGFNNHDDRLATETSTARTTVQPPNGTEAQFAPLLDQSHRHLSKFRGGVFEPQVEKNPPNYILLTTYLSFLLLIVVGHIRDFFGKRFGERKIYNNLVAQNGYAALNDDFDSFFLRRLKRRMDDCFARITTGVPGRYITILDRYTNDHNRTFVYTGTYTETLNMSSYNYLASLSLRDHALMPSKNASGCTALASQARGQTPVHQSSHWKSKMRLLNSCGSPLAWFFRWATSPT